MVSNEQFKNALDYIVKDIAPDKIPLIRLSVQNVFIKDDDLEEKYRALDVNLTSEGGFVFLWQDVLGLSEAIDLMSEMGVDLTNLEQSTIILKVLFQYWIKLRQYRLPLTEQEFVILRAIKKGNSSLDLITSYTGLSTEQVSNVIEELKTKLYKQEFPLLVLDNGLFKTPF